ncbi:MAG: DUF896 domain-containing protein [Lachnospiraceae bacterium]|nr:DUF896 domain-containing protein [Lachnospiraceae bacterium]
MTQEGINRINELARKAKAEGLTEEEIKERDILRKQFIADFRANVSSTLNNVDIVNEDGTVENLGERHAKKNNLS